MIDRGAGDKSSAVEPARGDDAARKGIPPKSAGAGGAWVGGLGNTQFTVTFIVERYL